jgi:glycerate 2-kinase
VTHRERLESLARAALEAVDPEEIFPEWWRKRRMALPRAGRVGVLAVGKAALGMAAGFERAAGRRLCSAARQARGRIEGLLIAPEGPHPRHPPSGTLLRASHPEPDRSSAAAARAAFAFFRSFGSGDTIFALVSGGTSSLLEKPAHGVTLAALRRVTRELSRQGAPIEDLNAVRTALSRVKGGRLAGATRARVVTIVLSDVTRPDPALVGSGPTLFPARRRDARKILARYGLDPSIVPARARSAGQRRKSDCVYLLADNAAGLDAAARCALRSGLAVAPGRVLLRGEAAEAGRHFARALLAVAGGGRGRVLLGGGETTVTIEAAAGRGGRNQEFAVAAAAVLAGFAGASLLTVASDGIDGDSKNAGGYADAGSQALWLRLGCHPAGALARHDTASLLERTRSVFRTGPTGTNVADWVFGLWMPERH